MLHACRCRVASSQGVNKQLPNTGAGAAQRLGWPLSLGLRQAARAATIGSSTAKGSGCVANLVTDATRPN